MSSRSSTRASTRSGRPRWWRRPRPPGALPEADIEALPHEHTRFAHNSERQFAKLLDFYGIVWDYEPRTFTLEEDREGNTVQAFTPDFYLPAYELYIEITTLNQKLVTKKNRKARRLRDRYPGTNIKVLYQRDYLALLVKYGLEPPSQLEGVPLEPATRLDLRPDRDPDEQAETA
ncbi:MAG TPA: hypothetical protein VI462_11210 [Acidimicrobiia bacterium]